MTTTSSTAEKGASKAISASAPQRSVLARFGRWEWLIVLLIVIVIVMNSQMSQFFLKPANLLRTSSDFMELGLMMLAMVFVIISTGNVDLSVASNLGMCASFMGVLFNHGVNIWIAALAALILGTLGGVLNGVLVARVKLPSLVVTLGTYAFYRGVAYVLLGDQAARGYPESFTYLGQGKLPGTMIPFSVGLFIFLAIIFGLILHKTTFGRYLYAIGNNQQAALYSGVPVDRIKIIVFTVSGFMAALAGLIMAARFGSTRPDIATGLELSVITAAVLGGIDISGGMGTMAGAFLSLLLIGLMKFGMGLLNIQGQVQGIAIGLLLIFSILIPNVAREISANKKQLSLRTGLYTLAFVAMVAIFLAFFFWSRAPVLAGG